MNRVEVSFGDEELLGLARAVNDPIAKVGDGLAEAPNVLSRVSAGDLTDKMVGEFRGAFATLQADMNGMIEGLRELVGEIVGTGPNLASPSSELRDTSDAVSRHAEQNAASLEEQVHGVGEKNSAVFQIDTNTQKCCVLRGSNRCKQFAVERGRRVETHNSAIQDRNTSRNVGTRYHSPDGCAHRKGTTDIRGLGQSGRKPYEWDEF